MITKALSSKLVLLVIGLAAGSGILIPAGYASFHPVTSSEIQNETILSADIKNGEVKTDDIAPSAIGSLRIKDNDVKAQDIAPDAVGASEIAANAVGTSELAANSVDASKIADGSVGPSDLGINSVGADEIQGVTKLLFSSCTIANPGNIAYGPGDGFVGSCQIGAAIGDRVIVLRETAFGGLNPDCFAVVQANTDTNRVFVSLRNVCSVNTNPAPQTYAVLVYREG